MKSVSAFLAFNRFFSSISFTCGLNHICAKTCDWIPTCGCLWAVHTQLCWTLSFKPTETIPSWKLWVKVCIQLKAHIYYEVFQFKMENQSKSLRFHKNSCKQNPVCFCVAIKIVATAKNLIFGLNFLHFKPCVDILIFFIRKSLNSLKCNRFQRFLDFLTLMSQKFEPFKLLTVLQKQRAWFLLKARKKNFPSHWIFCI